MTQSQLRAAAMFTLLFTLELTACGGNADGHPDQRERSDETAFDGSVPKHSGDAGSKSDAAVPTPVTDAAPDVKEEVQESDAAPDATVEPAPKPCADEDAADERAACDACNGEWGKFGISEFERCNCRTKDAGKVCRDRNHCEGQCLVDDPEEEVTDPGPPRMGYFIGRCAEFALSFGCHQVLPRGTSKEPPVNLDEAPPVLCMD